MPLANAQDTQVSYVEEPEWGVTPANPVFQVLRMTGETLTGEYGTVTSSEIRPDRNVTDLTIVSGGAGGGIAVEMSQGTFDDLIGGVLFGQWNSDALVNGESAKRRSFTVEKRFDKGGGDYTYFRYTGMIPNTLALELGVDAILTGNFEFMGREATISDALLPGQTYLPATTTEVFNATSDFEGLSIAGDETNYVQSLSINVTNNLSAQRAVGHLYNIGAATGTFTVTGSAAIYFRNEALYQKFINNQSSTLNFTVGKESGKLYKFSFPNIKFSSANVNATAQGADLLMEAEYQALYNAQVGGTMKIERNVVTS